MNGAPVLVLCATVPWRREACELMLRSLERQTVRPARVILHLDGFARATPRPALPSGLPVSVRRYLRPRGVGNWWRSLDESHRGMLVACVGDDFVYPPEHLERLVALQAEHGGAISWHGWAVSGENCWFRRRVKTPVRLTRCGTAFLLAPADDLIGIADHELADLFFHPRGHDEALISCWLWTRGVPMTRPAGWAEVEHLPVGTDARATSIRDLHRKTALRRVLRERYDWPDPPRHTNASEEARVGADLAALLSSRQRAPSRSLSV